MQKIEVLNNNPLHFSVVATSRNDNHGNGLINRMQHFVNGFIHQCIKHSLHAELVLVEWNPPQENNSLAEILKFPSDFGPCKVRIITVPPEIHTKLKHSSQLPLFQMIAKNVGIRRAQGRYILATNIDILFSDKIIEYIKNSLQPQYLYRCDRVDIPSELPAVGFDDILDFCAQNSLRVNGKYSTKLKKNNRWEPHQVEGNKSYLQKIKTHLQKWQHERRQDTQKEISALKFYFSKVKNYLLLKKQFYCNRLHTNACGDFTLLSKEHWCKLRGYPEWEIYSWHLDSVLLFQAKALGIKEIDLPPTACVYHIEHETGSGFTPEKYNALFDRLKSKGIPYLDDNDLAQLILDMDKKNKEKMPIVYNNAHWGYGNIDFAETIIN